MAFDRDKIIKGVTLILEGVGEDPRREGLVRTPERMVEYFEEVLSGIRQDPAVELRKYTTSNKDEMIIVKDILSVSTTSSPSSGRFISLIFRRTTRWLVLTRWSRWWKYSRTVSRCRSA